MFLGEHRHALDAKGRIVLPARFREALKEGCVITKGQDRCLVVFDRAGWDEYARHIRSLPSMDRRVRAFARSVFGAAHDTAPDGQGRIGIPQHLREYAGLERDIVVTGMDDRVEIWDSGAWERVSREADEAYPEISQTLAELQM